ncbi:MAG: AraC family transcriptional regulator [Gammaproteobacteria bacterium]|nr:MAG: AraC family transcriptional regulator [Gammaproteobacteria bacterium]
MKEHIFNIHDVILIMMAAECILLAIFQAVLPAKNKSSSILLTVFLIAVAVSATCVLMLWNKDVHFTEFFDEKLLPYFLTCSLLAKGAALYLYVRAITQDSFTLDSKKLGHLIPIIIGIVWLYIFQIDSRSLIWFRDPDIPLTSRVAVDILWAAIKIVPLVYSIAAIFKVRKYVRQLENQYSYFSPTEPAWLNVLTYGFLCSWSLTLFVYIAAEFTAPSIADIFGITDNYVGFILINALFIYSVVYAHQLLVTKPEAIKEEKLDEKIAAKAIQKVQTGMEEQKLYLKSNLNIEEFSKRIDLPIRDVSAVINKHYGTNFFEFMNRYRVEEAKRLLLDESCADMTIMDILLQAGFNSKSAFHRFFNRLVGISPSEYRKRAQQNPH